MGKSNSIDKKRRRLIMEKSAISKNIETGGFKTNYHDEGEGSPILLLHGSGPGVSAWANWKFTIPELSKNKRVLAPDLVGFGYTERKIDVKCNMKIWVKQIIDFLDGLGIEKPDIVGHSFGGAITLALATKYPERIGKIVLMGAMGVEFTMTNGLDLVWGYEPSIKSMKDLIRLFVYNKNIATDDLAKNRYDASIEPGFQESYSSIFPAPRQQWIKSTAKSEEDISKIKNDTLIIHGREDEIIPLSNAIKYLNLIEKSQLHVFGKCGHWTQTEHTKKFNNLLKEFFNN
jgi:2-hydroxymuconate-semialdehyde hydrolase